jgi:hypothetical protein
MFVIEMPVTVLSDPVYPKRRNWTEICVAGVKAEKRIPYVYRTWHS